MERLGTQLYGDAVPHQQAVRCIDQERSECELFGCDRHVSVILQFINCHRATEERRWYQPRLCMVGKKNCLPPFVIYFRTNRKERALKQSLRHGLRWSSIVFSTVLAAGSLWAH